jgi:cytochrome c biogenesis protein CcmG/thiol:disulfide interchange protein DsbE
MTPPKRVRFIALLSGVVGVIVVALIVLLATRDSNQATTFQSPLLGRPAPVMAGVTLQGPVINLANAKGHVVVVNFFASWCPPCQQESPQLSAFAYDQTKITNGAQMLGVVYNDSNTAMKAFIQQQGIGYPVLTDPQGNTANRWGVSSPPTTYIVAASGRVVAAYVGPLTAKQLDAAVKPYVGVH